LVILSFVFLRIYDCTQVVVGGFGDFEAFFIVIWSCSGSGGNGYFV
jgi:hypothetical protein